jgi:hypothetical protein
LENLANLELVSKEIREFWEIKESQATKELLVLTVRMVVTGLMVNPVTMERTGLKGKLELLAIRVILEFLDQGVRRAIKESQALLETKEYPEQKVK